MKILCLIAFLVSCAHQRTVQENLEGIQEAQEEFSQNSDFVSLNQSEEEVVANESGSRYSVSLIGDGIEAFSYIGLLKKIEQLGVKVVGLSGQGSSALVAGLYAKHGKVNMVEWILFKYLEKFFPYQKEYETEYRSTVVKLINREFKNLKKKNYKLNFETGSLLSHYQYILNEFEKEEIKGQHTYTEKACVYESSHYQKFINLCFFAADEGDVIHDDIDRKSFSIKWNSTKGFALVDIIESRNKKFEKSIRSL